MEICLSTPKANINATFAINLQYMETFSYANVNTYTIKAVWRKTMFVFSVNKSLIKHWTKYRNSNWRIWKYKISNKSLHWLI